MSKKTKPEYCTQVNAAIFGTTTTFDLNPDGYDEKSVDKSLVLQHGTQFVENISINYAVYQSTIKDVVHNAIDNSHIILFQDGNLCECKHDGEKNVLQSGAPIQFIIYVKEYHLYVSVCQDNFIRLLDKNFDLINPVPCNATLHGIVFNKFTKEIVTYGKGLIIIWLFRSNGSILIQKKIINEHLQPEDDVFCLCIEHTSSQNQRCFAAIKTNVNVYNLQTGKCLQKLQDLHNVDISQILFYQPLKLLVTSGKDGCIKTWNESWNLNSIFVGHMSSVTSLTVYPHGLYIMSSSLDGTFRTWSLYTKDEISCETQDVPISGLKSQFGANSFFSFSTKSVSLWKVENLHLPLTVIGSKVKLMKTTTSNEVAPITYCICDDACIRILCPITGDVVAIFISPEFTSIEDAVYHVSKKLLFVLLCNGDIVKACTQNNPCTVLQIWRPESTQTPSKCTCINLYEYEHKSTFNDNKWEETVEKAVTQFQDTSKDEGTFLIGGCADGHMVIYDWFIEKNKGKVMFMIKGHREEITAISSNPCLNQLATASKDNTLKIWRVFPFATESLAPLLMFPQKHTSNIMYSHQCLSVVYQSHSTSTYVMAVYKTKDVNKAKLVEHSLSQDHNDQITCVGTCLKLRLIASAALDCTVRIWNENNTLLRILNINDVAHSLTFCSQRGDILLGIGKNVHIIQHSQYLPAKYMYQMVAMKFNETQKIPTVPIPESLVISPDERARIFKSSSSFLKLVTFVDDDMPEEELQQRKEEEEKRKEEFAILEARNKELNLIKEGLLKSSKRKRTRIGQKEEAFKKYLDLFYTRPNIRYPEDDVEEGNFMKRIEDSYKPNNPYDSFFAVNADKACIEKIKENLNKENDLNLQNEKKLREGDESLLQPLKNSESLSIDTDALEYKPKPTPILRRTFSASTTYTERLRKLKDLRSKFKHEDYNFSSQKLSVIHACSDQYPRSEEATRDVNKRIVKRIEKVSSRLKKKCNDTIPVAPDGYLPNSVIIALYKELRREVTEENLDEWKPKEMTERQLAELNRVDFAPTDQYSDIEEFTDEIILWDDEDNNLDTPPLTPPETPEDEAHETTETVVIETRTIQPKKPIQKLIPKLRDCVRPKSPPREPTPPPRPKTPLPRFIEQFSHTDWFKQCIPDTEKKNLEICTLANFVVMLSKCLCRMNNLEAATEIISAIHLLNQQYTFDDKTTQVVRNNVLSELNVPDNPPLSSGTSTEVLFVKKSINLLVDLKELSPMVIVEFMVQFILAPSLFRKELTTILNNIGLQDPKDYFPTELFSNFDVSLVVPSQRRKKLHDVCFDWLTLWTRRFKQHITSLTGKLCRASTGNVVRGTVKQDNIDSILKKNDNRKTQKQSVAFVSNEFVADAAKNITSVEVLNYFCEMKLEEELERERMRAQMLLQGSSEDKKVDKNRNTVLMVPKIGRYVSLARIGETHASKCHPERETSLTHKLVLPPIENKHGVHNLMLHLKTLTLNPFPNDLDDLLFAPTANSDLVTLRYCRKYFVPSHSFVNTL